MNTIEPVDWNEKPASVVGNTITVKSTNGVNVGATKDGGVWIALLGGSEQAHEIAAIINNEQTDQNGMVRVANDPTEPGELRVTHVAKGWTYEVKDVIS